ncbi:MAG: hypothetical protein GTO02_09095 [Candidatus Dadabacteria bacterium]|nr:hypothetical protein [Candidatus Dadabacteria bacterium]NIQ14537.1 hypothetical protein [Candidatus Dadabacteria bacterium]
MPKLLNKVLFSLFTLILFSNCSASKAEFNYSKLKNNHKAITIWALADIQPRNKNDKNAFKNAVLDINENFKKVDIAIVAGDIVDRTEPEIFDWYVNTKNMSNNVDNFYEIIGNHDLKSDRGILFKEKIREQIHYSVEYGNLLLVFLSDEERGKPTVIRDETFNWWKDVVISNQDKIIIVVSHAPLEGSGIPFSTLEDRKIKDSYRFIEILKKYNVDLWFSGHLHIPHALGDTVVAKKIYNNMDFIHISSIRPEFAGLKHSESRILKFLCNTNKVLIRSRDHDLKEWQIELDEQIELSKKISCH